ncbi:hypothetical protein KJ612_02170 [Myxococcota bacterium]|nr:hypothetical protein [Myxococcota bacterium]
MRTLFFLLGALGLMALAACDDDPSGNNNTNNTNNLNNVNNANNANNVSNPVCGNGVAEVGEDCDATDFAGTACEDLGNFSGGTLACTPACAFDTSGCDPICAHANWEACEPLGADQCCPSNDLPSECFFISADAGAICMQTCTDGADCGYSLICYGAIGDLCFPKYCGGGADGTPLSQPCSLGAGRDGFCVGNGTAMDDTGICLEDGLAQHGEACFNDPENSPLGRILTEGELGLICDGGVCVGMDAEGNPTADGTCLQLCDPVAVYDGVALNTDPDQPWITTDTCPENSNCVNFSSIDTAQTDDNGDPNPDYLFRGADMGICYPTVTGVVTGAGVTSCDLLTGRSIRTGEACAPMPLEIFGFPVTDIETTCQILTDGTLIGACQPAETVDNRAPLGETCDPAYERTLFYVVPVPAAQCDKGTLCLAADPLHEADLATAETRCVKPCNAALGEPTNPDCSGLADAGGNPLICLTLSRYRTADHGLPVRENPQTGDPETEASPSTLGICVPAL